MSDALEDALRRDAKRITPAEAPAGLERRICEAIGRAEPPAPARRPLLLWASGLAAAGAAAALLLAHWPAAPGPASAAERADAAELAQAVQAMPAQVWSQVQPRMEAALAQDPLQQEKAALASDARSALGFLAYNFLPEQNAPKARRG